jgi:hypothetical protein
MIRVIFSWATECDLRQLRSLPKPLRGRAQALALCGRCRNTRKRQASAAEKVPREKRQNMKNRRSGYAMGSSSQHAKKPAGYTTREPQCKRSEVLAFEMPENFEFLLNDSLERRETWVSEKLLPDYFQRTMVLHGTAFFFCACGVPCVGRFPGSVRREVTEREIDRTRARIPQ